MGISRGFRRMSLLVAVLGATAIAFIWLGNDVIQQLYMRYGLSLWRGRA
jgi:hypothetical protein